jgi:hypothetical protein
VWIQICSILHFDHLDTLGMIVELVYSCVIGTFWLLGNLTLMTDLSLDGTIMTLKKSSKGSRCIQVFIVNDLCRFVNLNGIGK